LLSSVAVTVYRLVGARGGAINPSQKLKMASSTLRPDFGALLAAKVAGGGVPKKSDLFGRRPPMPAPPGPGVFAAEEYVYASAACTTCVCSKSCFPLDSEAQVNNPEQLWRVQGVARTLSDEDFIARIKLKGAGLTRTEFNKQKSWKQKELVTALGVAPPTSSFKFPHGEVDTAPDLDAIHWHKEVEGCEKSKDGSEGVMFTALRPRHAVVVKCPSGVAAEYFGFLLATRLDLHSPRTRFLAKAPHTEAEAIVEALTACDDLRPEGERSARAFFKHPFVLVEDYVAGGTTLGKAVEKAESPALLLASASAVPPARCPAFEAICSAACGVWAVGLPLGDMHHERPECHEFCAELFGLGPGLSTGGCRRMRNLGGVIAFDCLLCNMDR